ncbi:hypothetical protein KAW64_08780 [bacterium]|nr:hypothetical protein [bacterium]
MMRTHDRISSRPRPNRRRPESARSSGFALTELLIAVFLSVVVIAAAMALYSVGIKAWIGTASLVDVQREGSLAMEQMIKQVRPGSSVTASASGETLSVFFAAVSGDSMIAHFYVDGNQCLRDINGGTITDRVDSLRFSVSGQHTVNVDLWIRDDAGTAGRTVDDNAVLYSSSAVCRN